jgi:hypothetical protein
MCQTVAHKQRTRISWLFLADGGRVRNTTLARADSMMPSDQGNGPVVGANICLTGLTSPVLAAGREENGPTTQTTLAMHSVRPVSLNRMEHSPSADAPSNSQAEPTRSSTPTTLTDAGDQSGLGGQDGHRTSASRRVKWLGTRGILEQIMCVVKAKAPCLSGHGHSRSSIIDDSPIIRADAYPQ